MSKSFLNWGQFAAGIPAAFRKLDPRELFDAPVLFVVEVGAVACTVLSVVDPSVFAVAITLWLWLTVLFGTLAEASRKVAARRRQPACARASNRPWPAR